MIKSIKIIAGVFIFLLLILVITPIVFKGRIKSIILREANKSLNANLDVGKVSLSLIKSFPAVHVRVNDLVITGAGNFEKDTLLAIKSLSVSTGLMDLLNGSPYVIRKINVNKADVRLRVLANGKENWDIIKPSGTGVEETTGESFNLKLKSLIIEDSRFTYDDFPNATHIVLEGMSHSLSGDLSEEFTTIEISTKVLKADYNYNGVDYLDDAVLDWLANLDADLVKNIYTFRDNKLVINDFPIIFTGTFGMPEEGYDLDLTFSTPESGFKQLLSLVPAIYAKDFESVKTDGKISFNGFTKGKYLDDLYPAFGINLKVENAWFQYPGLPAAVKDIDIDAKIESPGGDLDKTVIDVKSLKLDMAGNPIKARIFLKNLMTDPYIDTKIEANVDLKNVGKFYPLGEGEDLNGQILADITLKGRLSDVENGRYNAFEASGMLNSSGITYSTGSLAQKIRIDQAELTITPAYLDLTTLKMRSGKSDFSLKGKLENYLGYYLKDEELKGTFDLRSVLIDVNELLALPVSQGTEVPDTSASSAFVVPPGIDFTLGLSVGSVKYLDYDISNLSGKVLIKDQKLTLDGISMNGMGGKLLMTGSYATTDPENPLIDFDLGLKNIRINEMFKQVRVVAKLAPIAEKLTGDFSGDISLAGLLDGQMMPRLESLTGGGTLITSKIKVNNVNTLNLLSNSLKMDNLKELEIAGATLIVELKDGVMEVKPFDFTALGIDMNLGGQTSLDQRIGYILKMKIPRSLMGGAANDALEGLLAKANQAGANVKVGEYINVDALIDGTITDPKVRLNLEGTGKDVIDSIKDQVQQQVEQKVEEVKQDIKQEAGKILEEADRQAQAILDEAKKQSDEVLKNAQALADETKKQADINAEKIIQEAKGQGFIAEQAAKKTADEVRKQGEKQSQNIMDEAGKKSAALLDKARLEADKIKAEAQKKVDQQ